MSEALSLQIVCEMARNLPCAPWLIPKLVKLLGSPNAKASDVEELIMKDPGLASATLRLANSAYFYSSVKCESLSQAIIRLGFVGIYKMAASTVATRWLSTNVPGGYGWEPGDLSKHSLCVAVTSDILSKTTGKLKPELAYTAGLLHDVGKLALAYACADKFEEIRQHQAQHGHSWRESEHVLLGYDHCDIGATMLHAWGCPDNLVQVASFYSRPQLAEAEHKELVVHIHASKHVAIQLGLGVGEEGFKTELDEKILSEFGYSEDVIMGCLPQIIEETEKVVKGIEDIRAHEPKTI